MRFCRTDYIPITKSEVYFQALRSMSEKSVGNQGSFFLLILTSGTILFFGALFFHEKICKGLSLAFKKIKIKSISNLNWNTMRKVWKFNVVSVSVALLFRAPRFFSLIDFRCIFVLWHAVFSRKNSKGLKLYIPIKCFKNSEKCKYLFNI